MTEHGKSVRQCCADFWSSRSNFSLHDKISGRIKQRDREICGKNPLFSLDLVVHFVEHLKPMSSYGYGYSRSEVVNTATDFAVNLDIRKKENPLSMMWFHKKMA